MIKKHAVFTLLVDTKGSRYDAKAGETRVFSWCDKLPREVEQAQAKQPIDWGGCMVKCGDYKFVETPFFCIQ